MKIYFEKINLSRHNTILNSCGYVHEITHTQLEKKGTILNHDNAEVLSIFNEFAFLYNLDPSGLLVYINIVKYIAGLVSYYDFIKSGRGTELSNYNDSMYFVSIAKAIGLFEKYMNNNIHYRDELIGNIQNVFDKKQTLENVLNNYNIDVYSGLESVKNVKSL